MKKNITFWEGSGSTLKISLACCLRIPTHTFERSSHLRWGISCLWDNHFWVVKEIAEIDDPVLFAFWGQPFLVPFSSVCFHCSDYLSSNASLENGFFFLNCLESVSPTNWSVGSVHSDPPLSKFIFLVAPPVCKFHVLHHWYLHFLLWLPPYKREQGTWQDRPNPAPAPLGSLKRRWQTGLLCSRLQLVFCKLLSTVSCNYYCTPVK